QVQWDFFSVPDAMHIYYGGNLVFNSGLVSFTGTFQTNFPGPPTQVTIVMNEGGNSQHGTVWRYTVTSSAGNYIYTTFTEDTNKTITPIKFAIPPYTLGATSSAVVFSNGYFEGQVVASQDFSAGSTFDGWEVTSNSVTLTNDPGRAQSPNQYVLLH